MKKMILIGCLYIVPLYADIGSAWTYGTAASCAQKGNWTDAQKQLNQLLINAPDSPDLLYDSGVTAYRLAEFEKAAAYFQQVATAAQVEKDLKKQAHFNLGNTKVAMNQLPEAIDQYQEVLAIEPDNEPALYNLEKVKEMLQQQQKQQQQQKNNKQDKNNNARDQQNEKSDQKNNQNQNQQESENQDSSESSQNNQNANKQEQQQNASKNAQQKTGQDQQQSMSSNQKEKQDKSDNQQGNEQDESRYESNQQHRNNKQNKLNNSHTSASEHHKESQEQKQSSKNDSHPTKNDRKEQGMQKGTASDSRQEDMQHLEQELGSNERWMARVLARQEKADATAQKILIKTTNINKQLAGNDGQNCW